MKYASEGVPGWVLIFWQEFSGNSQIIPIPYIVFWVNANEFVIQGTDFLLKVQA